MRAPARPYREVMGVARYLPTSRFDLALGAFAFALTGFVTWVSPNTFADPVHGPAWMRAVYPLLLAAPLAWRRVFPLGAFSITTGAVVLQSVASGHSVEGLQNIVCWYASMYAAARYSDRRRAAVALGVGAAAFTIYSLEDPIVMAGAHGDLWATSFFGTAFLATWLSGVFVRTRGEERESVERSQALERAAVQAVADERARLARELHDVISHNLSVMVVQAAGARAAGDAAPDALEKIERSGRESLVEMRRLLGVLRSDNGDASLVPQPGVGALAELVDAVRGAGVELELSVEGDAHDLPPALDLSVYRIIQESLTNVLKHSAGGSARVRVRCQADSVEVEVTDDGRGPSTPSGIGHGLIGMRERVAIFGGSLDAGPRPGGGFVVRARLPRETLGP